MIYSGTLGKDGELGGNRTRDNLIKRPIVIWAKMAHLLAFSSISSILNLLDFARFLGCQQNCTPEIRQNARRRYYA